MSCDENVMQDKETLLIEYAAGNLNVALDLLVACCTTICSESRAHVLAYEQVGGSLLEACCDPIAMKDSSLSDVLSHIDGRPVPDDCVAQTMHALVFDCSVPRPVYSYIEAAPAKPCWKKIGNGIQIMDLTTPSCEGWKVYLVNMAPGSKAPEHMHAGLEYTLILEGAFSDEAGAYGAGDLVIHSEGTIHRPLADAQLGCLCLSVMEIPVRFTRWPFKILNHFFS